LNRIEAPKGLNEEIVRFISAKKKEPDWLSGRTAQSLRSLEKNA
jgi:hypothetical protein